MTHTVGDSVELPRVSVDCMYGGVVLASKLTYQILVVLYIYIYTYIYIYIFFFFLQCKLSFMCLVNLVQFCLCVF